MKKTRIILFNIIVLLVAVVFSLVLILGHVGVVKSSVVVVPGSYGDQYAKDNHLNIIELADSQMNLFDQRYEEKEEGEHETEEDYVSLPLTSIPFEYNLNGNNAEIVYYTGNDDVVVIPSYIDGHTVTEISMDLVGIADVIVIPDTVTNITGESVLYLTTALFIIELFFSILAIILALIIVNVIFPRYSKDISEYMLSGSQMAASVLYVIAQIAFCIYALKTYSVSAYVALIVSLVILLVYVLFVFLGGVGRTQVKAVEKNVANKTARMKEIKLIVKSLPNINDPKLKNNWNVYVKI